MLSLNNERFLGFFKKKKFNEEASLENSHMKGMKA
jgi:hypothetical protein